MPWSFVGRAEQIESLRSALGLAAPGPLMIMGEPGMGRTSLLSQALDRAGPLETISLQPAGDEPLAALRTGLPDLLPDGAGPEEASAALNDRAAGHRLIVLADDAHHMDQASLMALRDLIRAGDAMLVVTRPARTAEPVGQDPCDCLAYEQNTRRLLLPPLSGAEVAAMVASVMGGPAHLATSEALRAATGGNPRRLRALLLDHGLAERMVQRNDQWSIDLAGGPPGPAADGEDRARLIEAVQQAWGDLAADRADQLCHLAIWRGLGEQVAPVWAILMLLVGRNDEAIAFLDGLGELPAEVGPQVAVIRAMILAIGRGQVDAAVRHLLAAAGQDMGSPCLLAAARAWILAVSGRAAEAAETLQTVSRSDQQTAMFVHATRAAVCGNPAETVFHLRRALAIAGDCRDCWPWVAPYLKACLIDALMLSGRIGDATSAASGFHAGEPGSGWEVAFSLAELIGCSCQPPDTSGPAEPGADQPEEVVS